MSAKPLLVVAGIGNGSGTGAATARLFAKKGYRVALVARNADHLNRLAGEINNEGGEAAAFPVPDYSYSATLSVFDTISAHKWNSEGPSELRVGVWNAGSGVRKGFLDVTEEDIVESLQVNVTAAFAFSRGAILKFKENSLDARGKRGTLIFTGATASIRGNVTTSTFAAGKFGIRALSQSLAKEFGKQNIHVAHAIIDGAILTGQGLERRSGEEAERYKNDLDVRLDATSLANNYLNLVEQDRSAWTWELDFRPAHEKW
ncbi:NAD-P-binding protein [Dichomitus squalens]|uniref:NAD-P-binding protein n=1 Tax=Dichomitus squalens TaxID=114155 RepID=A0A4Q9Q5Z0_9APHY|nr:NAD-P-binding protein [Dichomitus squalens]TBU62812.1 NAD-P-binding protein [Dichomitus squalens]